MLVLKVLILEFLSVNRFSAGAITTGKVAALCHEAWDDAVEERTSEVEGPALLAKSFFTCAKSTEVL